MLAAIDQEHIVQLTQPRTSEALALDYGVQSTFLSDLDVQQKLQIFDLTARASRELHRWAARYPLIRRVRVWPLSLSVAAAAPFATVDVLMSMARMSLWIFTIDDIFDEEIVPFSELHRRVDKYKTIVTDKNYKLTHDRDTLALALQDIRNDLKSRPLFENLHQDWSAAVQGTLTAMMHEYEWRATKRTDRADKWALNYNSYMEYGIYSVGGPPVFATSLISINDPSVLERREPLKTLQRTASICLRLANDLQSHAREITEGKINSVSIRQHDYMEQGYTEADALVKAKIETQRDIHQGLEYCKQLERHVQTKTRQPEQAITGIARFVCDFYVHHDYHTFMASTGRSA